MDFLDPKKQKAHARRLAIGYALIGIALLLATTVLLYRSYGFGLDKSGRIIQNGLVFVSSQPGGADVFISGHKYKDQTNTRIVLPGGQYTFELKRDGYRPWKRAITVEGGSVGRFDYPFLFPTDLNTTIAKQYESMPLLATQSPDRRWLFVQTLSADQFDVYDLDTDAPSPKPLLIPAEVLTPGVTTQAWQAVEWADDNRHVVLKRLYQKDGQTTGEYILVDRERPAESRNLSVLLGFSPTTITLRDHDYDRYFAFDQGSAQLFTATLEQPTPQPYLSGVATFDADGDGVLYVTAAGAPPGEVFVRLRQGDDTYTVRQLPAATAYVVGLARYQGTWVAAAGSQSENRVYVYENPADKLKNDPAAVLVPAHILRVEQPNHLSFSLNARFVMAENGGRFAVYDIETAKGYAYEVKEPIDNPQTHAEWLDGYHFQFVSGGNLLVFDFDGANQQILSPASPAFTPFFDRSYRFVYAVTEQKALSRTALRTDADL